MGTVSLQGIHKAFGTTTIVEHLDLDFPDGSFTVLVGPSGCGKSTTLRMIAGLEPVTSGTILINDQDVTDREPRDRNVAMVFQNYALYPHLTVAENIAFPLRATKTRKDLALKRAGEIGESLGLGHLLNRKPKELSGGQQQRVAIGRAIIREPAVFLFDEPLSNLDAKLRVETRSELLAIQRRLGVTSIYVTHDQEEAMTLSDRMVVMKEGKIAQVGTPSEVYSQPNSVFVATFVGSPKMNILEGNLRASVFTHVSGESWALQSPREGKILVGLRPEDVVPTPDPLGNASIEQVELLGPRAVVTMTLGGQRVVSVVDAAKMTSITPGAKAKLDFSSGVAHLFDPETELRIT
jgi:multiple sugar transport system ATP-binding protein